MDKYCQHQDQKDDPLRIYMDEVNQAIRDKKVFTTIPRWVEVCNAFEERGWIEKLDPSSKFAYDVRYHCLFRMTPRQLLKFINKKIFDTEMIKRIIRTYLLGNYEVDFIWYYDTLKHDEIPLENNKIPIENTIRIPNDSIFQMKSGIAAAFKAKIPKLRIPRSYVLKKDSDLFWQDFNIVSAMSLLKYVVEVYKKKISKIISPSGQIPLDVFEFAITVCRRFLIYKVNRNKGNLDKFLQETEDKWDEFHQYYYKLFYLVNHFKQVENGKTEKKIVSEARLLLAKLSSIWPYLADDGYHNIWLLKPIYQYGGFGIHLCRTKEDILKCIKDQDLVAQKYIERPLLIYNTKFDIRQWLVITKTKPLTIWICKDFYLRFCRETFCLRKLHEKIHLTNTCVQDKYTTDYIEDSALPDVYLWTSNQFKDYLNQIGYSKVFEEIIFPGIKENIISYTVFHKDSLGERQNCFQILGADFLLSQDFKPWLLEMNDNPAFRCFMPFYSELINTLFRDVLEDREQRQNIGCLELIYQESKN